MLTRNARYTSNSSNLAEFEGIDRNNVNATIYSHNTTHPSGLQASPDRILTSLIWPTSLRLAARPAQRDKTAEYWEEAMVVWGKPCAGGVEWSFLEQVQSCHV